MKIFVTGACGYKGSVLVPKLLKVGHKVVAFDVMWFGNFLAPHPDLTVVKGDVRNPDEAAICRIPGSVLIPLPTLPERLGELDPAREMVVHCKGGVRSAKAIEALTRSGFKGHLVNLKGGITAWSNEVDPSVPKY